MFNPFQKIKKASSLVFQQCPAFCTKEDPNNFSIANEIFKEAIKFDLTKEEDSLKKVLLAPLGIEKLREDVIFYRMSAEEKAEFMRKKWKEKLGDNYEHFSQAVYRNEIKGLHGFSNTTQIDPSLGFKYSENNCENYKFSDNIDYELDDELEITKNIYIKSNPYSPSHLFETKINSNLFDHPSQFIQNIEIPNLLSNLLPNQLAIYNIPQNITAQILVNHYKLPKNVVIDFKRCVLNIPAIAILTFPDVTSAENFRVSYNNSVINYKKIKIKKQIDAAYEAPENRTLVIAGIYQHLNLREIFEELNKYGQILHFEFAKSYSSPSLPLTNDLIESLRRHYLNIKEMPEIEIHELGPDFETNVFYVSDYLKKNQDPNKSEEDYSSYHDRTLYTEDDRLEHFNKIMSKFKNKIVLHSRSPSVILPDSTNKTSELSLGNENSILGPLCLTGQQINDIFSENLGYIFLTFASTDQAKHTMIELMLKGNNKLGDDILVTLRHNKTHMEWDALFAFDYLRQLAKKEKSVKEYQLNLKNMVSDEAMSVVGTQIYKSQIDDPDKIIEAATAGKFMKTAPDAIEYHEIEKYAKKNPEEKRVPNYELRMLLKKFIDEEISDSTIGQSEKMLFAGINKIFEDLDEDDDNDTVEKTPGRVTDFSVSLEETIDFKNTISNKNGFNQNNTKGTKSRLIKLKKYSRTEIVQEFEDLIKTYVIDPKTVETPEKMQLEMKKNLKQLWNYTPASNKAQFSTHVDTTQSQKFDNIKKKFFEELEKVYIGNFSSFEDQQTKFYRFDGSRKAFFMSEEVDHYGKPYLSPAEMERIIDEYKPLQPDELEMWEAEERERKKIEELVKDNNNNFGSKREQEMLTNFSMEMSEYGVPDKTFKFVESSEYKTPEDLVNALNVPGSIYKYMVVDVSETEKQILRLLTNGFKFTDELFDILCSGKVGELTRKYLINKGLTEEEALQLCQSKRKINQKVVWKLRKSPYSKIDEEYLKDIKPYLSDEHWKILKDSKNENVIEIAREQGTLAQIRLAKNLNKKLTKDDLMKYGYNFAIKVNNKYKATEYDGAHQKKERKW